MIRIIKKTPGQEVTVELNEAATPGQIQEVFSGLGIKAPDVPKIMLSHSIGFRADPADVRQAAAKGALEAPRMTDEESSAFAAVKLAQKELKKREEGGPHGEAAGVVLVAELDSSKPEYVASKLEEPKEDIPQDKPKTFEQAAAEALSRIIVSHGLPPGLLIRSEDIKAPPR